MSRKARMRAAAAAASFLLALVFAVGMLYLPREGPPRSETAHDIEEWSPPPPAGP